MTADLTETAPGLIDLLRKAGDDWGPRGVALTAAALAGIPELDEAAIRADERRKVAALLDENAALIGAFCKGGVATVRLVALLVNLGTGSADGLAAASRSPEGGATP